ncbi:MAG: aldose epimerase [Bacillota bacterium]|nr:aldose epimerase [Bacillota bacterium]
MYELKKYKEFTYDIYEIIDNEKGSWLKVVPERGGIIIGFGVNGEEILFLNQETLANPEKNIRGGIPILFPISGQLENGEYEWKGTTYQMKNHGVARNDPWDVIETKAEDAKASMTLLYKSNHVTKKAFPFDFQLRFTYTLQGKTLTIGQEYQNKSQTDMPIYAGFHPYFQTTSKNIFYQTDAKTYLDYNDMVEKKIEGSLDLTEKKESFALIDAVKNEISFELPDRGKTITMTYGKEFTYIVLWTEKDRDFLCVEPWMAKTGELNRKEELVMIKPGETLTTFITMTVE